jgi:MATE family multidrug resistance protein
VIVLLICENLIIAIFTNIDRIIIHIQAAWLIFNCFVIFDTTQGVASSAIRASGQQKKGAVITGVAYWVFGIPITLLMVFKFDLGTLGIWVGPTFACAFNTAAYLWIFNTINWSDLIVKAAEQREKDKFKRLSEA